MRLTRHVCRLCCVTTNSNAGQAELGLLEAWYTADTPRSPRTMTPNIYYRYACLLGSFSLAKGFHVHAPTLPKLAALPMGTSAGTQQVSPVSTPEEQYGHEDLFDWNKQVTSESDRARGASRRNHDRLVQGRRIPCRPFVSCPTRRANGSSSISILTAE